jgi:hypothetical protein
LNRIPHPWTLLGSDLVYPGLDSSLLKLKVLIPPWTTYLGNLYPIGLPDLTRSAYLNLAQTAYPNFTQVPYLRASMLTRPYTFILGPNTLHYSSPNWTCIDSALYSLTQPNYLTRCFSDRTSAYQIVPGHLTRLPYPVG